MFCKVERYVNFESLRFGVDTATRSRKALELRTSQALELSNAQTFNLQDFQNFTPGH